ncbi:ABC transporter permease [Xylanimonas ulmi]|uniref:Monosaccharide ABC transporter membrane protein (CUT2 family) n=1 Tax=Xylanimonas ulmi TaxID=228973 RepID=A0A4Q7M378_9MICO|nr:ABC transporter permease [Xylanibacterium ulmi]RZS60948.1 monosaccharide ABC transporter membrane protein (CUT2 family) [Xylanibacterium ulmi]
MTSTSDTTPTRRGATSATRWADLARNPLVGPLAALVVAVVAFSLITDTFLRPANLSLILQQSVVIGILAVAQTVVILTAGIDLSIGAVAVLGTIILAKVGGSHGPEVAIVAAVVTLVLVGLVNGALVAWVHLPPFIVTLGVFTAMYAATQLYAGSQVYPVDKGILTWLGTKLSAGGLTITTGVLAMLAIYLVAWYVLSQTAAGRHLYAVGGAPEAARLSGIRSGRVLVLTYLAAGLIAAVAAWAALGRIPNADPNAYQNANLETITAVVIGGTSLFGGRGSVLGTLAGTLIVAVLRNGLTQAGVDNLYQNIATGVLVIAAVALDQVSRRRVQT